MDQKQSYRETDRWQRFPGSGRPKKTTASDERYFVRLEKRIGFCSLAQVTQTGGCYAPWTSSFQTNCPEKAPWSGTLQSCHCTKPDISLENRLKRRRWCTRTLNWTVSDNWSCLLFSNDSRFNLAYCDERVRLWRTAGEEYISECLCMVNRNRIVFVMVWVVIGYHDENLIADNYVRTLSENRLDSIENTLGNRNHPFVFQHVYAPAHTARRTVEWLEQQDISTIQWPSHSPDLKIIAHVWVFMGREIVRVMPATKNDLIRALHNSWLNITLPYLHNLYNSLPGRVMAVIKGRCYPTKHWLTKYFR